MVRKLNAKNIVTLDRRVNKSYALSQKLKDQGFSYGKEYKWYFQGSEILIFEFKEEKDASYFALTCL